MSSAPLDVVFVTGDESAALKRADTARKLATYLERMPPELRGLFADEFQHINRAELAQLRATGAVRMIAKCECCGKTKRYTNWPQGWTETYVSKYGKQYNPDGLALWCSQKCLKKISGQKPVKGGGFIAVTG